MIRSTSFCNRCLSTCSMSCHLRSWTHEFIFIKTYPTRCTSLPLFSKPHLLVHVVWRLWLVYRIDCYVTSAAELQFMIPNWQSRGFHIESDALFVLQLGSKCRTEIGWPKVIKRSFDKNNVDTNFVVKNSYNVMFQLLILFFTSSYSSRGVFWAAPNEILAPGARNSLWIKNCVFEPTVRLANNVSKFLRSEYLCNNGGFTSIITWFIANSAIDKSNTLPSGTNDKILKVIVT